MALIALPPDARPRASGVAVRTSIALETRAIELLCDLKFNLNPPKKHHPPLPNPQKFETNEIFFGVALALLKNRPTVSQSRASVGGPGQKIPLVRHQRRTRGHALRQKPRPSGGICASAASVILRSLQAPLPKV